METIGRVSASYMPMTPITPATPKNANPESAGPDSAKTDRWLKNIPVWNVLVPVSGGLSLRLFDASDSKLNSTFIPPIGSNAAVGTVYSPALHLGPLELSGIADAELGKALPIDGPQPFYGALHVGGKLSYEKDGEGLSLVGGAGGILTTQLGDKEKKEKFLKNWRGGGELYAGVELGLFPFRFGVHRIWSLMDSPLGSKSSSDSWRFTVQSHF